MAQNSKAVKLSDLQQGRGEIENFVQRTERPSLRLVTEAGPKGFETLEEAQEAVRTIEAQNAVQVAQVSEIAKSEPKAEPRVKESEVVAVADLHRVAQSTRDRIGDISHKKSMEEIFDGDEGGYVPLESLRSQAPVPKRMSALPQEDLRLPSGVIRTSRGWRATPSEQQQRSSSISVAELPIIETYDKVPLESEAEKVDSIRAIGQPDYGKMNSEQMDSLAINNQELIEVRNERQKCKDDPEKSAELGKRYAELKEERKILIQEINAEVKMPEVAMEPDESEAEEELSTFLSLQGRLREVHQAIKELRKDKEANKDELSRLYREEFELKNQIVNLPSDLSLSNEVGLGVSVDKSRTFEDTMYLSEQLQDELTAVHQEMRILRKNKDANQDRLVELYRKEREIKQGLLDLVRLETKDRAYSEDEAVEKEAATEDVSPNQTVDGDSMAATESAAGAKYDYGKIKKAGAVAGIGLAGGALVGAGLFAKAYYWVRWKGPLKLLEGLMKFTGDPGGSFTKAYNKFDSLDPYKAVKETLQNKDAKKEK